MSKPLTNISSGAVHSHGLIELAGVVASQGPHRIRNPQPLDDGCLQQYWAISKCRIERWSRGLKQIGQVKTIKPSLAARGARMLIEEILAAEPLTRTWAAVLAGRDEHYSTNDAKSIVQNVMLGHLEIRHRALQLVASGNHIHRTDAAALWRLRRRLERWTDLLVANLLTERDVSSFAINPARCRDFAEGIRQKGNSSEGQLAWQLAFASYQRAFSTGLCRRSPNGDLNCKIASSIIPCLDTDHLDATGVLSSIWLIRLIKHTDLCERMIDQLLETA